MKSKKYFYFIAMVLTVLSFGFVACGDKNDEPSPDSKPVIPAKIAIAYTIDLGDGWWKFFDIEVTYTTAGGTTETKSIQKGWTYVGRVDYEDALTEYSFTAKATPKASIPEIDENARYDFDKKADAYAYSLNEKEEQVGVLSSKNSYSTMSIAGSHLSQWLKEHTNLGAGTMTVKK